MTGGAPQRLTWHPAGDAVQGWTPDGEAVAFFSTRQSLVADGGAALLTVSVDDGRIEELEVPYGYSFSLSADGRIASSSGPSRSLLSS